MYEAFAVLKINIFWTKQGLVSKHAIIVVIWLLSLDPLKTAKRYIYFFKNQSSVSVIIFSILMNNKSYKEIYNHVYSILRLFDGWANFLFTTSKTKPE